MAEEGMSFGSHLEELRRRLIYTILFFFIVFSVVVAFGATYIINYIQEIAIIKREVDGKEIYEQIHFTVIGPMETFSTTMRVSFYAGIVLTYPFAMIQAWLFIAPGLYRHERRFFLVAIPSIFLLFAGGAAFGRYVMLPLSIPFLLDFNVEKLGVVPMYTLREFLDLVFALTFGLGFIFQLPLLVAPLIRFGLLKPDFFRRYRRYTIFIAVVIGALISPTGSPVDMIVAGAPVFFLVEGGVLLGKFWKNSALKQAEREAKAAEARGEKVDYEALAGGLAMDLEEKLKHFAGGGARQFARDLLGGFKEGVREAGGGFDVRSLFDDDHKDDAPPPAEVKLKTQPRRKREVAPTPVAAVLAPASPAITGTETKMPDAVVAPASAAIVEPADDFAARPAGQTKPPLDVPGVSPDLALYIDNRIACRLDEMFEERIKPFLERALKEAKQNGNGHRDDTP